MITHTPLVAGNLPINFLIARRWSIMVSVWQGNAANQWPPMISYYVFHCTSPLMWICGRVHRSNRQPSNWLRWLVGNYRIIRQGCGDVGYLIYLIKWDDVVVNIFWRSSEREAMISGSQPLLAVSHKQRSRPGSIIDRILLRPGSKEMLTYPSGLSSR